MTDHSGESPGDVPTGSRSTPNRVRSTVQRRAGDGSLAFLAGAASLAWAIGAVRRREGRAAVLTLTGLALLGVGARQRRATRRADGVETGADARRDEAEGGGDVDFVEGKQPATHRESHAGDETASDPRLHTGSDAERTEVDLSSAAVADEASEAAGPHPEQAYPAREGTDPEPLSEEAPPRVGQGAVAPGDTDADADADGDQTESGEADEEAEGTRDGPDGTD
jgi:hypothetical protein